MGRLIYLMNPLYYISEALTPILVFHFIALIAFQPNTIALYNSLLFAPKILYELFLMPVIMRNHRTKMGSKLAAMNNIFTYFYTIFFDMPKKSRLLWHPAGVSIGGISREFRATMRLGIILTTTYVASLAAVLMWRREYILNIQMSMVLLWTLYVAAWYMIYIYHATHFLKIHDTKYEHPTSKIRTHTRRTWAHVKHAIMPSLTLFLFFSICFNIYQLSGRQRSAIVAPSIDVNLTGVKTINASETTQSTIPDTIETPEVVVSELYSLPLIYGDSRTLVARRAIQIYLKKTPLILTRNQLIFAEDSLQKELKDVPNYADNIMISVAEDRVKFHIDKMLENGIL
jgi:hypothetical protein